MLCSPSYLEKTGAEQEENPYVVIVFTTKNSLFKNFFYFRNCCITFKLFQKHFLCLQISVEPQGTPFKHQTSNKKWFFFKKKPSSYSFTCRNSCGGLKSNSCPKSI